MVDVHTKAQRSYNMSRIKCRDTSLELKMKKILKGYLYQPNFFGKPDFVHKKKKIAVFIDGCFWHNCPKHYIQPKSNKEFWTNKIKRNVLRDEEVNLSCRNSGWKVIRIWEHDLLGFKLQQFF